MTRTPALVRVREGVACTPVLVCEGGGVARILKGVYYILG